MKKYSKLMAVLLVVAMLLPGIAQAATVAQAEGVEVTRLGGVDRVGTSVLASQEAYDKADAVVLAGFGGDVDALTGTLLAAAKKAPLLITRKAALTEEVATEIARLEAKTVYILGGETVVSAAVQTELEKKYTVKRIAGDNREETAVAVAKEVKGAAATHVFLTLGRMPVPTDALADALAIGPVSAMKNMPVLLTGTKAIPASTAKAMKDMGVTHVTIIGGPAAVSADVATELAKDYTVNRVAGDGREDTALEIAAEYFATPTNYIVAYGRSSADALVGGYLGAMKNAPILLTNNAGLTEATKAKLAANPLDTYILGGTTVITKTVEDQVVEALGGEVEETELKVESVSAITKTDITVTFNRAVKADDASKDELVVVAPNGLELIATGTVAEGATSATYTFQYELNQTGTYTVKGTDVKVDYVTSITALDAKLNSDNSAVITGTTLLADAVQVSVDGTNFVNATLSADGSFAYTTPILSSGSQTITVKAVKGSTVATKTVNVGVPTPAQAAVISAEAINPREVKVVFNQEVQKTSAETIANYKVTYDTGTSTVVTKADLQNDNKTVILTVTEMLNGKAYKVEKIENVLTKSNNQKMVKYEGNSKLFTNIEGPKLLKVERTVDNKFKLTFDKHVAPTTIANGVKIDGVLLTVASADVTVPSTDAGVYTATTRAIVATVPAEAALVKPGAHTAVVSGAGDVATSTVVTPVQQMSFTVTQDTTAPSVTSVTPKGYNSFEVKFSEPIYNAGSLAGNLDFLVTSEKLVVKKGNFVYPKTVASADTDGFVSTTLVPGTVDTYLIKMNDKVKTGTAPNFIYYDLYDGNANATQLSLTIKGYQDAVGLIGNVYNTTVTLTKETVKPTVVSTNLNSTADGQNFVIKFSEDLKGSPDFDASKVAVYDSNNVLLPLDTTTPLAVSGDTLTVKTAAAANPTTQLFKVVLNAGAVQDLVGNKNASITTYVDNRAAAAELTMAEEAAAGHAASISNTKIGVVSTAKNVITVNYGANKMGSSAILAANYKLDGAALPVGTNVDFVSNSASSSIVEITLPNGIYSVGSVGTLELSKGIKSADGSLYVTDGNDEKATARVALSDNIKPVLTGAKFVASSTDTATKTIELTFSEGLAAITADAAGNMNDFVVIIGGAEYKVTKIAAVTDGDLTARISIAESVNLNNTVQVKVVPEGAKNAAIDTIDTAKAANGSTAAGNKLTTGTTVTVTGKVTP